jgi:muconolactone delta-isomerase
MEYLVTMTTHVPDGTPAEAVDGSRAAAEHAHRATAKAAISATASSTSAQIRFASSTGPS